MEKTPLHMMIDVDLKAQAAEAAKQSRLSLSAWVTQLIMRKVNAKPRPKRKAGA